MSSKSYPQSPLTGQELLAKLKTLEELNKSAKAKACGYVKRSKQGKERAQLSEFMNAILEAQGINLDVKPSGSRHGRSLNYRARVQKNGTLIIGAGYTKEMGLEPGQPFEIKLGRKAIKLTAISSESVNEFEETTHEDDEFDSDEIE